MKEIDTRLLKACKDLGKMTLALNDHVITLHKVVEDYVQADQERENKIRELEDDLRNYQEEKQVGC